MRVSELYSHVAGLGFEVTLENGAIFYQALNRALLQVSSIRPVVKSYIVNHRPMENLLGDTCAPCAKTSELCFEAEGAKSYYFECDGTGTVYLERYDILFDEWVLFGFKEFSSYGEFIAYRGFIKDGADFVPGCIRLRFVGEYLYSVKNVALYEHIFSEREEDIQGFGLYVSYDISVLVPDFLSLENPPIKEDGEFTRLNYDYDIEGGRVLLLPRSVRGVFKILYRHRPDAVSSDGTPSSDETILDLDEELCSLLPTLIASYVWAEDEPSLAEYYRGLYAERAADVERRIKSTAPVHIKNTTGW